MEKWHEQPKANISFSIMINESTPPIKLLEHTYTESTLVKSWNRLTKHTIGTVEMKAQIIMGGRKRSSLERLTKHIIKMSVQPPMEIINIQSAIGGGLHNLFKLKASSLGVGKKSWLIKNRTGSFGLVRFFYGFLH